MTSSVDYDIAQLQADLNRLQSDLARLENDLTSEKIAIAVTEGSPIVAEEIAADEILTDEGIISTPIIPEPVVYENQGWASTPISTTSMIDEEIAQVELMQAQQALTTAAAALTDAEVANPLANSNMENMNMINPLSRSQKIRNAIAALLAAASTLIAAEAGAMWEEDSQSISTSTSNIKNKIKIQLHLKTRDDPVILKEIAIKNAIIKSISHNKNDSIENFFNITLDCTDDSLKDFGSITFKRNEKEVTFLLSSFGIFDKKHGIDTHFHHAQKKDNHMYWAFELITK